MAAGASRAMAASEVLDLELEPVFGEAECVKQLAKGSCMVPHVAADVCSHAQAICSNG